MKLEAHDHPKTLALASLLAVELPTAIGYLELLFAFVAKRTPQGNVGKWADGVIASACFWRGEASVFVKALVESGYLDSNPEHRLLVHDWPEHCPNWVRAKLKKDNLEFILSSALKEPLKTEQTPPPPASNGQSSGESNAISSETTSRADLNQGKPNLAQPSAQSVCATENRGSVPRESEPRELSYEFDDFAMANYPPCTGRRSWTTALHHARVCVSAGKATEADLRRRLTDYRAFIEAGGHTTAYTPQNFFDHLAEDPPCLKEWPLPAKRGTSTAARATWHPDNDATGTA